MNAYNFALIPGDGIGVDVIDEGMRVVSAAAAAFGFTIHAETFPWTGTLPTPSAPSGPAP
ncbi:MAG: hypothetical protein RRC07_12955 [Anaerolineae bacterium]|nr:hypothetical protein [Anaerolineae bacterium]